MKRENPRHHIKHLRKHRNFLYGIVVVLLILQILTFVSISGQISKVSSQQTVMKEDVDGYISDLSNQIEGVRQENQFNVNEITKQLTEQKKDIRGELALLKATREDFSGIIDEVIQRVVNVRTDLSGGTGFVVGPGGYIVTNYHIIKGSRFVNVQTFEGKIYNANLIGFDDFTDLALLQITGVFDILELAKSDDIQTGEKVIAIGNPLGLSFTVTEGIVSATKRQGPNGLYAYIQTDVTLNPGNSGGPLINKEGKVIGINNFKIWGAESLGFALESDVIRDKINELANKSIIE